MSFRKFLLVFVAVIIFLSSFASASRRPGWTTEKVDLRAGNGRRIKAIHYPKGRKVHRKGRKKFRVKKRLQKKYRPGRPALKSDNSVSIEPPKVATGSVMVNTIDSPPIDGFVPWIAVTATDEMNGDQYTAKVEHSVVGSFLPGNPQTDFAVGLYDTGASTHVIGYQTSQILNMGYDLDSGSYTEIKGVTGSVIAWVCKPISIFIAGLNAIDTSVSPMQLDTTKLVGESNVAVAVGDMPATGAPDLPTAIGSPMSVYYTAVIGNDRPVTVHYQGKNYTAPNIELYPSGSDDPGIPNYNIEVPLELRPIGASEVSFVISGIDENWNYEPATPSIIAGNGSQSLFFVHAVDLYDKDRSAYDKTDFMIDTGAQVTVIGKRTAARLELDPDEPEFIVDIEGVSGDVSQIGGFYLDRIDIPALGEWVSFTNIPVIMLDIASPEGGTLDGIIGMNLFNDHNMVFKGGGIFLQDDPSLEIELINATESRLAGDIAPDSVDGVVDGLDLAVFMQAWLTSYGDADFNPVCDIAPEAVSDGKVNLLDFSYIAANWMRSIQTN